MSHELLISPGSMDFAKEFMRDHKSVKVMRFEQVSSNLLINLDNEVLTEQ